MRPCTPFAWLMSSEAQHSRHITPQVSSYSRSISIQLRSESPQSFEVRFVNKTQHNTTPLIYKLTHRRIKVARTARVHYCAYHNTRLFSSSSTPTVLRQFVESHTVSTDPHKVLTTQHTAPLVCTTACQINSVSQRTETRGYWSSPGKARKFMTTLQRSDHGRGQRSEHE